MALCNVTGTVYLPSGAIAANRRIVFRREVRNITAEYLGAMFPDDVITTTSETGEIDVNLVTGRYIAFATGSNISFFGVAVVPDAATANFADILNLDDVPDTPPVWYQQALDARDDAETAAVDAAEALADAEQERLLAEQARQEAEGYAEAAAQSAQFYDTIAAGRAAVADGETFGVRAGGSDGLTRPTIYRRDSAATQTVMVSIVSPSEVDAEVSARKAIIYSAAGVPFGDVLTDGAGGVIYAISQDGRTVTMPGLQIVSTADGFETVGEQARITASAQSGIDIGGGYQRAVALPGEMAEDGHGGVYYLIDHDQATFGGLTLRSNQDGSSGLYTREGAVVAEYVPGQVPPTPSSGDDLAQLANTARLKSLAARTRGDTETQPLSADYNVLLVYGQSNAFGTQAHPHLTLGVPPGVLMLGRSERPTSQSATTWTPVGDGLLHPYTATSALMSAGNTLLTQAEAAAVDPASGSMAGESTVAAAVDYLQRYRLDALGAESDPRQLVVINCAVPGQDIASLSYGATSGYFNRIVSALTQVKAVADAESKTVRVGAVIYTQGESDYSTGTVSGYKASLKQLIADIHEHAVAAVLGQTRRPSTFLVQIADGGVSAAGTVAISEAQRQAANEEGWFIVRRVGTSKGLHHDPNGARWTGSHLGRALAEVMVDRQAFVPPQPIDGMVVARGNQIIIPMLAPAPLEVGGYYRYYAFTDPVHRGIDVRDDSGAVAVSAVDIVNEYLVRVTCARDLVGTVTVRAGERATGFGNVGIYAKTGFWVRHKYEFISGMDPAADIPALVGQPYPSKIPSLLFEISTIVES